MNLIIALAMAKFSASYSFPLTSRISKHSIFSSAPTNTTLQLASILNCLQIFGMQYSTYVDNTNASYCSSKLDDQGWAMNIINVG